MLTVIVPVYNVEGYIGRCIESIQKQTYDNIEIILVDDGSTDNSGVICDQYAQLDSRIKVFHVENGGPSKARNFGLNHANGRYIAFVDSDDYVDLNMYEELIKKLQSSKCGMVICGWVKHVLDTGSKEKVIVGDNIIVSSEDIKRKIMFENQEYGGGYPWNRVVDYALVKEKAGRKVYFPEDISVYEDKCWVMEVLNFIDKIYLENASFYHYVQRTESLTHRPSNQKRYDTLIAWFYLKKNLTDLGQMDEENQKKYYEKVTHYLWKLQNIKNETIEKIKNDYLKMYPEKCGIKVSFKRLLLSIKFRWQKY